MIIIEKQHVYVGIDHTSLNDLLVSIDKDATLKASICSDLESLFVSLISKYDKATIAYIIEISLKNAIEHIEKGAVNVEEVNKDDKTNT